MAEHHLPTSRNSIPIGGTMPVRRRGSRWASRKMVRLSEEADGELDLGVLDLIVVLGVEIFDFGVGHVQLRLR
jgi:hypothetical protein